MTCGYGKRRFLRATLPMTLSTMVLLALPAGAEDRGRDSDHRGSPDRKEISIAEARGLRMGTVVTVTGSVTVPSGTFSSSLLDQGFAIQDYTGGIYVSVAKNSRFELREQVRVTGRLSDGSGQLVLLPRSREDLKSHDDDGPKVQALRVATGAVGAATVGKMVQVLAPITQPLFDDPPFGFIVVVNDGSGPINVYVNASTGIDIRGLRQGQTLEVTGFSGQFDENFEIDVRFQRDMRILSQE